jgi:molybdopterin synthase catalytic subunit
MQIAVRLFGPAAQRAGSRELRVTLEADRPTCAAVRAAMARAEPRLAGLLQTGRFAVNHEFAADDDRVSPGDEVALIAGVSGG